jgi:hypothetical protein
VPADALVTGTRIAAAATAVAMKTLSFMTSPFVL